MHLGLRVSRNEQTGRWSVSETTRDLDHSHKAASGWPDNDERMTFTHDLTAEEALAKVDELMTRIKEG